MGCSSKAVERIGKKTTIVCDAWPVRCQTYSYATSSPVVWLLYLLIYEFFTHVTQFAVRISWEGNCRSGIALAMRFRDEIVDFKNAVTLKTGLGVHQGHWKYHHLIERIQLPTDIP